MDARTLALLACLALATLLLAAPAVGTAPDASNPDAATTTAPPETAVTPSPTEVGTTSPRSAPSTNDDTRFSTESSSRQTTTTEYLGPGPDQPRGSPSAWTNAVRYLLFPGAVLGLFVGLVDGLTRAFPARWRRLLPDLVGLAGVGLVSVAVVGTTTWPLSGAIALGGLGASCTVVAVVDRRGGSTTARLGAAAGVAAAVLAVAVGADVAGATPQGPPSVVVAAPGMAAATLFAVGSVAAGRSGWTAVAPSVLAYWAGAVAAGVLGIEAQGMGAGFAMIALVVFGAITPLVGIPLYALGVSGSSRDGADDAASNRR